MRFREFLLNEEPLGAAPGGTDIGGAPPMAAGLPPAGGGPGLPPPPPPMGGPIGGGPGAGGPGGMPPMGGPPMGGTPPTNNTPIKPKSFDVWSVLEEILDKKKNMPSKKEPTMLKPKSLRN